MNSPNVGVRSCQLWTACDDCAVGTIGLASKKWSKDTALQHKAERSRGRQACRSSDPSHHQEVASCVQRSGSASLPAPRDGQNLYPISD